jgi:hypothetical protein
VNKAQLQAELFRIHEAARVDDTRRRRINRIFCEHLDRLEQKEIPHE